MKKWYASKTLWVNAIAFVGVAIQVITGNAILDPELQASILAGVNIVLRFITKEGLIA